MISQAFNEWTDGLAAAILVAERRLRPPRRFELRASREGFQLFPAGASAKQPLAQWPRGSSAAARDVSPSVLQQTRGSIIEIEVPASAILERRLDPLPGESRPYVENVVRHQIESIFPWRSADTLHATAIRERGDGRIDVIVRATARTAVADALAVAAACGAREAHIVGSGGERNSIPVPLGSAVEGKLNRARGIARYALAASLLFAVCLVGWTTFTRWSVANELAAIDQTIAERRAVLRRAAEARLGAGQAGLEAKKRQTPVAAMLLETLSSLLPDHTYLTDFSLDAGRLRITGNSRQAAELIPLLEETGRFKNASFYAPTTRLPGGATDRFSIEAEVVPQAQENP